MIRIVKFSFKHVESDRDNVAVEIEFRTML